MTTRDTLHFLTCGHVDDGKSTLIGRLLHDIGAIPDDQLAGAMIDGKIDYSRLTDGLEDERAQGITIDVAYRYFRYKDRHFRIADTPGHVQYVRNMAVAAANSDAALILVDAGHGVREQTIRHSKIAAFFGIRDFIIVINKMDVVNYSQSQFGEIMATYRQAMQDIDSLNFTFIPVSAKLGENVTTPSSHMPWYEGLTLLDKLLTIAVQPYSLSAARLPVQYVIRTPDGRRGYMGTLSGGKIKTGDSLKVLGNGQNIKVSHIYHSGALIDSALPGYTVMITSEDDADIARGAVLASPTSLMQLTDAFMGNVLWLDETYQTQDNVQAILKIHHAEEQAELHMEPNASTLTEARIFTASPVAVDSYLRDRATGLFMLIQPETEKVIGIGTVQASESATFNFEI